MIVLKIIGICLLVVLAFIAICALYMCIRWYIWFQDRSCKKCGHHLDYRGYRQDGEDEGYLFYCPHCHSWEKIPSSEFVNNVNETCNKIHSTQ
jgi:hypothetical protein